MKTLHKSAMASKPGLNSLPGSLLRETIVQYNTSLRARARKRIEEVILKRESRPVLGTPQALPKAGVWQDRPEWMYEHRIQILKTWDELHQEQTLKLNQSVQEEWNRLRDTTNPSQFWELQRKVAKDVEEQVKTLRTDDEAD